MSPEKQRIAIAEFLGHRFVDEGWRYPDEPDWQEFKAVYRGEGFVGLDRPEYPICSIYFSDVGYSISLVKKLSEDQQRSFAMTLWKITETDSGDALDDMLAFHNATPSQRVEAFLKTIGKWEDGTEP